MDLPPLELDPDDSVLAVCASSGSEDNEGNVSADVGGKAGDRENFSFKWGLRRGVGAPWGLYPVLRDDLQQRILP